jgi:hypothetical protein
MATKKTTKQQIADATKPAIGQSPRPTRARTTTAKDEGYPLAQRPAKKAAAKSAAVTLTGSKDGIPTHVVKNLKGLREAMDKHPKATGYSTDRKFGIDIVNLHNTRGRVVAEIKLIQKAK